MLRRRLRDLVEPGEEVPGVVEGQRHHGAPGHGAPHAPRHRRQPGGAQRGDRDREPSGLPGRDRVEREPGEPGEQERQRRDGDEDAQAPCQAGPRRVAPQRLEPLGGEERHGEGADEQAAGGHPEAAVPGEHLVEEPVELERSLLPQREPRAEQRQHGEEDDAPPARRSGHGQRQRRDPHVPGGLPEVESPEAVRPGARQHVEREPPCVRPAPAGDEGVVHHHRARPQAGQLQRGEDHHRREHEADRHGGHRPGGVGAPDGPEVRRDAQRVEAGHHAAEVGHLRRPAQPGERGRHRREEEPAGAALHGEPLQPGQHPGPEGRRRREVPVDEVDGLLGAEREEHRGEQPGGGGEGAQAHPRRHPPAGDGQMEERRQREGSRRVPGEGEPGGGGEDRGLRIGHERVAHVEAALPERQVPVAQRRRHRLPHAVEEVAEVGAGEGHPGTRRRPVERHHQHRDGREDPPPGPPAAAVRGVHATASRARPGPVARSSITSQAAKAA